MSTSASTTAAPSLVIMVDTEPDDQWAPPIDGHLPPFAFENSRDLGRLVAHARGLGVPITWLTSYSVARDPQSAAVLRRAADEGDEIGGHLHGWETPPFVDVDRGARPFVYEYPAATRLAKHEALVAAHEDTFGARPRCYRAGRWGVDPLELEHLAALGYRIDMVRRFERAGVAAVRVEDKCFPKLNSFAPGAPRLPHRGGSVRRFRRVRQRPQGRPGTRGCPRGRPIGRPQ